MMQNSDSLIGIIAALPVPALLIDTSSDRIAALNKGAAALLGVSEDTYQPLSAHIGSAMPDFLVLLQEAEHRGQSWTRSVPLIRADGQLLECELRASFAPGAPDHVMLTVLDLKELDHHAERTEMANLHHAGLDFWHRAEGFFADLERQNQLILNAAGEGIYGINAEGKTTFVNRAAQEMLGWTTEDLLGHNIHHLIHHHHINGDVYPAQDCPIFHSFRYERVSRIEDEYFWRKDGKPIRVEYISTPIYDQQVLVGAVVIFRDITQRKADERALRDALEEVAALRDRLEQENAYLNEEITHERAHHDIVGSSAPIREVRGRIELVARTDATVMITGETGTGKALIATAIHKACDRARGPHIHFKCSSVAPDEIDAELFGQVRSSGATRDKPGKLELAHGGTLYLDDVDELPREVQGKLLHALQSRSVTRLGDTREKPLDLRVIAASSSANSAIRPANLREDLYLHLNVFPITSHPLRDRKEDIPQLSAHLLKLICRRLNRPEPILTEGAVTRLQAYDWPGNVRELRNVIERAAIVSSGDKLVVELEGPSADPANVGMKILSEAEMQDLVRANTVACLRETIGKVSGAKGAARRLGIKPTTLYSRIQRFGIEPEEWSV